MTDRAAPLPDAATVQALARLAGYAPLDPATAERVVAGAAAAVAAVRATATESLFDVEPGRYLDALERLAEPGP